MKRALITVVACFLAFSAALPQGAAAQNLSDLERERNAAAERARQSQNNLQWTQSEQARILREMDELDRKIAAVESELEKINKTLDEMLARLAQAEKELLQAQSEYDEQYEMFRMRLRALDEYGQVSLLEVLFQATNIKDFLTRLEIINSIALSDRNMTKKLQEKEAEVALKREEIARSKLTVESLQAKKTVELQNYENVLAEKEEWLIELSKDEEMYLLIVASDLEAKKKADAAYNTAYAAEQKRLEEEAARRAAENGTINFTGSFLWPLPQYKKITSYFGWRNHPIYKRREHHNGVDIAANMGSSIRAAESGKVIMAGRNGSYGITVMIDHGGGVVTMYCHASQVTVNEGQSVKRGDEIAKVGSTGMSTGPHLHFEVIIGNKSIDPKGYLGY
ncbi:MAG: peptidoglycan DD-metalloendopeptidase family protein [Defluviitaleaceae bacterium]|nr:peptidoglycan DD-metalloendopeptidase family protein [Defluviitaleaceae bacterium]